MFVIKKRIMSCALLLLFVLAATASANQDSVRRSVVRIYTEGVESSGEEFTATGTGFAVGSKQAPVEYFVTNDHVVEDAKNTYIIMDEEGTLLPCEIVATSDKRDLALLRLKTPTTEREASVLRPFDAQEMAMSTESVWAYGYPGVVDVLVTGGSSDSLASSMSDLSVTTGTITRIDFRAKTGEGEQIIHDASVSGGNSGGPLVDKDGYVLGVNTWAVASSRETNNADVYGAISVNEVVTFLDAQGIGYTTVESLEKAEDNANGIQKDETEPAPEEVEEEPESDTNWRKIGIIAGAAVIAIGVVIALVRAAGAKKDKAGKDRNKDKNKDKEKDGIDKTRPDDEQAKQRFALICETGALVGSAPFKLGDTTVIGRDPQRCNIVFPRDTKGVSHVHCTLFCQNGMVVVRDENSSFGTKVDRVRLEPGKTAVLYPGQRLYLGSDNQVMLLIS